MSAVTPTFTKAWSRICACITKPSWEAVNFPSLRSADDRFAHFYENGRLVAVAQILGQRLEDDRVLDALKEFFVELGSKALAAHRPNKNVTAS